MRKHIFAAIVGVMSLGLIGGGVVFAKGTRGGNGGRGGHTTQSSRGAHTTHKATQGRTGHYGLSTRHGQARNQAFLGGNRGRAGNRYAYNGNRNGHNANRNAHNGNRIGANGNRNGRHANRNGGNANRYAQANRNGHNGNRYGHHAQHGHPGRHGYAGGRNGHPGRFGYPGRLGYARNWHGHPGGRNGNLGWYGPGRYTYPGRAIQVVDHPDTVVVQPPVVWPAIDAPVSRTVGTVVVKSVPEENGAVADEIFPERFLRIKNTTAEPMKVYVQFHTQVDEDKWMWVPAEPKDSAKSVMLQVDGGEEVMLADDEGPIGANRVRIWAVGPSKRIAEYRNQDLWLVPETNQAGEHVYRAPEIETFTYVLR